MTDTSLARTLRDLTDTYLSLHTKKEDLFWESKMGLGADAGESARALGNAEIALNRFLQDPDRLRGLRSLDASGKGSEDEKRVLRGWIALFRANVIEDPKGRELAERIVAKEQELQTARGSMALGYVDPATGKHVPASSVLLSLMMRTDPDESRRKAAYEGLRSIESFVLENGFLEIVSMRNELGRLLGYEDYYDYRVQVVEQTTKRDLFQILSDLESRTASRTRESLDAFVALHGPEAKAPWNFMFLRAGDVTRALDPYFAFDDALLRWGRSFAAMGVRFRGATLTLDLVDRKGKYENGFMHGPNPAFFDDGRWQPARINFTANAIPGAIGSGLRAAETLFHEGGHAAHFSNILADAPCFSQEFAPTSVAYAETQSMFMDSLLGDADWRAKYARDASGGVMPWSVLEASIREKQPFRGWDVRALMTVPFGEKAIYELTERDRTPERVLSALRAAEVSLQGLDAGIRPVLAVPHLLAGESSAYYHAYVLAEMAVHQTRSFFLQRDGQLTDNPRIGPDLARAYWAPGNNVSFNDTLVALTGSTLSAAPLADVCNASLDAVLTGERAAYQRALTEAAYDKPVDLDATVRVVHGATEVASTERGSFESASADFAKFIRGATTP